jgi:deazaflavin-dependent oxidoreductase (nitroreductase family)
VSDASDLNRSIIERFRANGGKVGGPVEGFSVLLLHTTGARSGAERVTPVTYQVVGDAWAVFATHAGGPKNPAWYYNIVAHPETIIELGADTIPVRARVAAGEERDRIWALQKAFYPRFERFEAQANREIPVVILERLSARRPGSRPLDLG